jgi:hypothetical protein
MLTMEQRKDRFREAINGYDRQSLTTAEFRRQLYLAHSEGLLGELLQQSILQFQPQTCGDDPSSILPPASETRSILSPVADRNGSRSASEQHQVESSSLSIASASQPPLAVLYSEVAALLREWEDSAALSESFAVRLVDFILRHPGIAHRMHVVKKERTAPQFDMKKLEEAVHYICSRASENLGAVKLNKILYYSDMTHYAQTGNAITGATYAKQFRGPVPKQVVPAIDHLVHDRRLSVENVSYFDFVKREFTTFGATDDTVFSKAEIERMDFVIHSIDKFSAREISDISHTIVWKSAELGETLPYDSFFVAYLGDITDEDMKRALTAVQRVEKENGHVYA